MNTVDATTHIQRRDSAQGQPSSAASYYPIGVWSGAATTARGMILGHPALGSQDVAAPRHGMATLLEGARKPVRPRSGLDHVYSVCDL